MNSPVSSDWQSQPPYRRPADDAPPPKWLGSCHCGAVQYQLSRDKPLASKYCHCADCQILHGAPFQWAAIFHKTDLAFINGTDGLVFYHTPSRSTERILPCKVSCAHCRTPIMDEGRRMISMASMAGFTPVHLIGILEDMADAGGRTVLFPTLVRGINSAEGREAFEATMHLFYRRRVVDFRDDGRVKWEGLYGKSRRLDDDGNPVYD